ncbi:hypothetical protein ACP4OV_017590 [Aristida adscensionis]
MGSLRTAAALASAVLALALSVAADAAVDDACKAVPAGDKRIDLQACVSHLTSHPDSPGADTWGLAKVAALVGVNNADLAAADIKKAGAGAGGLAQCAKLYTSVRLAFAGAKDEIDKRAYDAGKQRLAEAMSLTQQCSAAFAKGNVPPPLAQRNANSVQIAMIATALTDELIN